jgi:hypothetical protein
MKILSAARGSAFPFGIGGKLAAPEMEDDEISAPDISDERHGGPLNRVGPYSLGPA